MWGLREREVKGEAKFEGLNNGKESITRNSGVKVGRLCPRRKSKCSVLDRWSLRSQLVTQVEMSGSQVETCQRSGLGEHSGGVMRPPKSRDACVRGPRMEP